MTLEKQVVDATLDFQKAVEEHLASNPSNKKDLCKLRQRLHKIAAQIADELLQVQPEPIAHEDTVTKAFIETVDNVLNDL